MFGAFGRDEFIAELWELLEEKSVHLLGERRVGKTTVVQEMAEKPQGDTLAFFFELEAIATPEAFALALYEKVAEHLPLSSHISEEARRLWERVSGVEVAGAIKIPRKEADWHTLLERTFAGLAASTYRRVVFFFDEVAMMLQEMPESDRRAMLNTLRQLRQVYGRQQDKIRMVYTGSIGLHHVLDALHERGYTNRPTNDMTRQALPPLSFVNAKSLSELWLTKEGLTTSDTLAAHIAEVTDGLPYYIRELVRVLKSEGFSLNEEGIAQAVRFLATDADSPIELDDYDKRINGYYAPSRRALARALLDTLAREEPLTLPELASRLPQYPPEDLEATLKLLEEDLYVRYDETGRFVFRYGFIRRVWLLLRRLG